MGQDEQTGLNNIEKKKKEEKKGETNMKLSSSSFFSPSCVCLGRNVSIAFVNEHFHGTRHRFAYTSVSTFIQRLTLKFGESHRYWLKVRPSFLNFLFLNHHRKFKIYRWNRVRVTANVV